MNYIILPKFRTSFLNLGHSTFIIINDFQLAKELFAKNEFSARLQTVWHRYVRGHKGRNLGIVNTSGEVWQEQRRFALKHLRDLGFGRRSLDAVIHDEANDVIKRYCYPDIFAL